MKEMTKKVGVSNDSNGPKWPEMEEKKIIIFSKSQGKGDPL